MRFLTTTILASVMALAAHAAPCEARQFDRVHGEMYLEAENAYLQRHDAQKALALTEQLLEQKLSCYEREGVLRLRAGIFVSEREYAAAINVFEALLETADLSAREREKVAEMIHQLNRARQGDEDVALKGLTPVCLDCSATTAPKPLRPPEPVYPAKAIEEGLNGNCDVRFDISKSGQPEGIRANCTDPVFEQSAINAIKEAEFAPKVMRGEPVRRTDVTYPIAYKYK